jgi:two-component system, sensor histidine kinase and response regulator
MALTPEILIPRLGDVLVEQGLIKRAQLLLALENQKQARLKGNPRLLGQIIVDMGLIDQKALDQAITRQILQLQTNLIMANETLEQRVKERTQELEVANKKLSELAELKANFISNISHELRTPLTHINGYTNLLLSKGFGELNQEQIGALTVLRRASERLERLIEDLILFSTSETNKFTLDLETFDLSSIPLEVKERFSESAKQKQIDFRIDQPQKSIFVNADKTKVTWVINQLIENALKFTPPKGQASLQIKKVQAGIKISVHDSGIGIDPKQINEAFEPFHQLDGSSTRKQGGTGLGLSLAKKIIEAHGSKIEVESVPGKGSVFSFCLNENP